MAGLIGCLTGRANSDETSANMALAGHLEIAGVNYPRLQLLTVSEMFEGGRFRMPRPVGRSESGYDSDLFSQSEHGL